MDIKPNILNRPTYIIKYAVHLFQDKIVDNEEKRLVKEEDEDGVDPAKTLKGLSVFMTSVFMVGEMAGSGVLALPAATEACGKRSMTMTRP
jgi:hypothetical protein